jgi:type IV pilus assembly protein PilX
MMEREKHMPRMRGNTEKGVVLFVALIVLVVMALTGLAMIRQSSSGLSIAGNLSMRRNALSGADLGTEAAVNWWQPVVTGPAGGLDSDITASGYLSDWGTTDPTRIAGDPSKYDWSGSGPSVLVTSNDGSGNAVRYIIERMCKLSGTSSFAPGQECIQTSIIGGNTKGGDCANYPNDPLCKPNLTVYYRISSQVKGPRNSISYIQVMVIPA